MALAGVIVIIVVVNEFPEAQYDQFPMAVTSAIVGFLVGWRGLGRKMGVEDTKASLLGLRAGVTMFIWVLFFFGLWRMIEGIMKHEFYQPLSAILTLFGRMVYLGRIALTNIPVLITIIILSMLAGVITRNAWLKWDQSKDLQINR